MPQDNIAARAPATPQAESEDIFPASQEGAPSKEAWQKTLPPSDAASAPGSGAGIGAGSRILLAVAIMVAAGALAGVWHLQQKLDTIQEQLARQSSESSSTAMEARATARTTQEQTNAVATQQASINARLDTLTLQRSQIDALMQSIHRNSDETLVLDIESSLRMAQQQTQLSGSLEPLVASLRAAERRINRSAHPNLAPLSAAIRSDLARVQSTTVTDVGTLVALIDDLLRKIDTLPLPNDVGENTPDTSEPQTIAHATSGPGNMDSGANAGSHGTGKAFSAAGILESIKTNWRTWLSEGGRAVWQELRSLVRVTRIERPESALTAPDQAFFLREKVKIQLLNARLGVLARQYAAARADLDATHAMLGRYFDGNSERTRQTLALLRQISTQLKDTALPSLEETMSAINANLIDGSANAEAMDAADVAPQTPATP